MDKKQYLYEVGQNLADLFYNQNKMKQTAVEWLIEQLTEIHPKAFEQAKEMEKEQIIQARTTAPIIPTIDMIDYVKEAEQYYNEQYGNNNNCMEDIAKRVNELAEKHPNYTGFFMRKVSSKTNPECKCVGVGYCYAEDKDNNIVRPCELNKTSKSE